MKSIVAFALLGALAFVAVQADQPDNGDAQGVAGFPLINLSCKAWKTKINQIVKTFNDYAGSTEAYTAKEVDNLMKVTGNIIVVTKNGETRLLKSLYLNRFGGVFPEIGEEIEGPIGIIGGDEVRLYNLSDSAFEKIMEGFENGEACLSSLPNDLWVFGKASFDNVATVAVDTAKMIFQRGADAWTKAIPLSQARKDDIAKLLKSGIKLAIEPAKIFAEGVGSGSKQLKDLAGVVVGVPLAMGSSVARTGADIVSTGAGFIGKMADNAFGFASNIAGLNKQKK